MIISFSPLRCNSKMTLTRQGDALTVNGETFDFGALPDGATLPAAAIASDWIGPVERADGELVVTLRLPIGANAPHEARYPQPITVQGDGPIDLSAYEEASE